jgi:hypothetical protein
MAKGSAYITSENITEWMASTGFLFPRTMVELARFEKLYSDELIHTAGIGIDPEVILGYKKKTSVIALDPKQSSLHQPRYQMAARKGKGAISKNTLNKIKNNQDKRKQHDPGSEKDKPE